jgi:hypothetical protein
MVFEGQAPDPAAPGQAPDNRVPAAIPSPSGHRARAPGLGVGVGIGAGLVGGMVLGALSALLLIPGAAAWLSMLPSLPQPARAIVGVIETSGLAGLQPSPPSFAVVLETVSRATSDAGAALEVAGEIRNLTTSARAAPAVELTLLDAAGQPLRIIRLPATGGAIPAGGRSAFETVALDPPAGTARVSVRLGDGPLDRL